jgi:C4-dicarboxylate transporter DctM subunit
MITGLILFGGFAVLLVIGVPIAVALGVATMLSMLSLNIPIAVVAQRIFTGLDSTAIMAIPFFVLAGNLMSSGGISRRLVAFVNSIVGKARGDAPVFVENAR